jgi:hypothetical protein
MAATPLERGLRALFGLLLIAGLATVVAALALHWAHAEAVIMASVVALLVVGVAASIARRRSRRVLQANAFRICPRCLAPLTGDGPCARCGFRYGSAADVERIWRELYGAA